MTKVDHCTDVVCMINTETYTYVCFVVRAEVDNYIGIDYSLLSDPVVTGSSLDMDFRVSDVTCDGMIASNSYKTTP